MKKSLLPALLLAFLSATSYGQATLTAANFNPILGDLYVSREAATTGVTEGASGPSQTWNFSSLTTVRVDTGGVLPCAATPNCVGGSTWAISGTPSNPMVTSVIADASKYAQNGSWITSSQYTVHSNPLDQIRYPFTYMSGFTDTFVSVLTNGPITTHVNGTATVLCDAWGTITVPGHTFSNALRVHSAQMFIDSSFLLSSTSIDTFQLDSYTWYVANYHSAVMTITYAQQLHGSISYKLVSYSATSLNGVADLPNLEQTLELFPNPAGDEVNIRFDAETNDIERISIVDMVGREVAVVSDKTVSGLQHIRYNTSALQHGLYLMRLQTSEGAITRRLEVR